ncbi:MAG: acyl carrier protein [Lysobacterales bacterium]|nr:acyl carrier protein [Xanthomonadales bacterium]
MIQRRVGVVLGLAGLLIAANVAGPGRDCSGGLMSAACAQDSEDWDSDDAADDSDQGGWDDAGSAGSQSAASNEDRVRATLHDVIRQVLPELGGHDFADGDSFSDLGANSVDRSEIVMMTMETLGVQIPFAEFSGARNIGQLVSIISSKM